MFNKLLTDTEEVKRLRSVPLDNAAGAVLLKLMFCTNRYNLVKGTPAEIVKRIGVSQWDFNHGVRALKKADYVRKYTKQEYMINPRLLFNGDDQHYYVVKHMWDTQTIGKVAK